ncbi:PstS family phosphate ABC transporter substrate-binding protein [Pedobacter sp. ASV28]|uniref:PstS family phosphate ABC transporter substrate-binding protein n=1 Tax=Pedobacter sp. ASV28 TaxID=2795123 RepID=UPI0018EA6FE2|nr:substrate-binding domain-containing protein [Pedobacter sp. ASV28]
MRKISALVFLALFLLVCISCNRKTNKDSVKETRTSGTTKLLVDESFSRILDDQIQVFKSEYPETKIETILGNENKIIPLFLKREVKMMVLSRMLKPGELSVFKKLEIPVFTDRFGIDGIALIANVADNDSTITAKEVYDIVKGTADANRKLVFDNALSSTIRYFMDSAKVDKLPKSGIYTLQNNNDVIKYVAENKGYIGVVGVNWLLENNKNISAYLPKVKTLGVKNLAGKKGDDAYYQPKQENLINGKYPFLRNIYLINAEGRDGLGTGFANWLASPRGQLIVLKSGLGPHKIMTREFNLKTTTKN